MKFQEYKITQTILMSSLYTQNKTLKEYLYSYMSVREHI